jgi:hypothetical protein
MPTARSTLGGLIVLLLGGAAAADDGFPRDLIANAPIGVNDSTANDSTANDSTDIPAAHAAFAFWSAPPYTPDALQPTVWWLAYVARSHGRQDGVRQTSTSVQTALRVELGLTDALVAGVAAAVALEATSSGPRDRVRTGVLDAVIELR